MAGRVLMAVILIVEDDGFIREIAEMMIQDLGHHTLSASDIDEALLLLRSPQHIDALFTDIYLGSLVMAAAILRNRPSRFGQNCVCSTRPAVSSTTK
jgi:CheY-like chemotaxis protein